MARIFISYRRGESSPYARMMFDSLSGHFGHENVFYDHKAIEPGLDFLEVIHSELHNCEVLIALIGVQWIQMKGTDGLRRIDQADDIVHQEIATALARNIRLIPVLVQGAGMPRQEELPAALAKLAYRNALELTDAKWEYDQQQLIQILQKILEASASSRPAAPVAPIASTLTVDQLLRQARCRKAEADELLADADAAAHKAKLKEANVLLQRANELDPTNTAVLLETAQLLIELTPDDPSDEIKLLRRLKKLLTDPADDEERFQLAQAGFLLATLGRPVDTGAIEESLAQFKHLGKSEWIRRCNDALKGASPPAPPSSPAAAAPGPPPIPIAQPAQLTAASFFGRWHTEIIALVNSTMTVDFYPNGTCQGVQQIPFLGNVPFQGNWFFEPVSKMLQLQCLVQYQPVNLAILIQSFQAGALQGADTQGAIYRFRRA